VTPVPDHAGDPVGQRRILTGPNALTAVRLAFVPVLAWLLFAGGPEDTETRWWAMAVFIVAAVTDVVDGAWARAQGSVTTLGKIADPIADKAITGVALVGLSWWGVLPWWVTLVILGRELLITVVRFAVIRHGVIPASRGGKAKTFAQIIAISAFLAPVADAWDPVRWVLMAIALLLTIATGIDYLLRAFTLRRRGSGAPDRSRRMTQGD
jgi:CDP-diacylglycerol---glycerol-3-phosphate 3-phosphatidyltransferase